MGPTCKFRTRHPSRAACIPFVVQSVVNVVEPPPPISRDQRDRFLTQHVPSVPKERKGLTLTQVSRPSEMLRDRVRGLLCFATEAVYIHGSHQVAVVGAAEQQFEGGQPRLINPLIRDFET